MASSISVSAFGPKDAQQIQAEKSSADTTNQQKPYLQSPIVLDASKKIAGDVVTKPTEPKGCPVSKDTSNDISKYQTADGKISTEVAASGTSDADKCDVIKQQPRPSNNAAKFVTESDSKERVPTGQTHSGETKLLPVVNTADSNEIEKTAGDISCNNSALKSSSKLESLPSQESSNGLTKSSPKPIEITGTSASPNAINSCVEESTAQPLPNPNSKNSRGNSKTQLEDGEEPEKKAKLSHNPNTSKESGKSPEQILELMDKTFEQRRKIVTKQMPTIPELKEMYPDLFAGKQLLLEFQRITKIDIDQKIQEFCVRYATTVIELAKHKKEAAPVLVRWEQAKQENDTLRQYWDMVTALCLLPLHFGENFVEMVLEIGEDEEVVAQGKIVPTLVARGNIFRTDEFFLIAENTIVQEFEEFTIAFASLYSSYWVFNMEYPQTIENTYNYIQRCIVRQREPGAIPIACKNFTKTLLKWNKGKEGK